VEGEGPAGLAAVDVEGLAGLTAAGGEGPAALAAADGEGTAALAAADVKVETLDVFHAPGAGEPSEVLVAPELEAADGCTLPNRGLSGTCGFPVLVACPLDCILDSVSDVN